MNRLKWNVNVDNWKKNRRTVEEVPAWLGWDNLMTYYNKCPTDLHRNIFVVLFETGGRVSEVLELRPEQFIWNDEAIKIDRMVVLKYRKRMRRDFLIKRDEQNPLGSNLISFVESCKTGYLFPKVQRLTGKEVLDKHTSRTRLYVKVREISDDLWCHWFRAQRASFNVFVRGMDAFQLADWFKWKSMDTPLHYINQTLAGMAENMGIKNIPTKISKILEPIEELTPVPKIEPKKEKSVYDLFREVKKSG